MKIKLLLLAVVLTAHSSFSQNEFITTWETTTPNETITIPTTGTGYNYDVDWENDSTFDDVGVMGNITHTYAAPGIYTVAIRGNFPRIYFNNSGDKHKIKSILQWGNIVWASMHRAFDGCNYLEVRASDAPNLANVTDASFMFRCTLFTQPTVTWLSINHWDVSSVINMRGMFQNQQHFNLPLNSWDVSNVTNMSYMFDLAHRFNQPLNSWDVSSVVNMNGMFNGANFFNQPIGNWIVSSVTNMGLMFQNAQFFNQPLNNWDVSSVTDMHVMFSNSAFNEPIDSWNVANVTNMSFMFSRNSVFNQPLDSWDVSSVTNMSYMFWDTTSFNQPINSWDVSNVQNMTYLFNNAQNFNQPLNSWDVSNVYTMYGTFQGSMSFNRRLGAWNVNNVTDMTSMFQGATSFNQPLGNWDVSNVTNMSNMFNGATGFDQTLGVWDVSSVTIMSNMFLNVKLSTVNYDNTLINWDALNLQPNVSFHGGLSQYCNAASQRTNMINNDGWVIVDGGQTICPPLNISDEESIKFAVYPNPVETNFSIESTKTIDQLTIYNLQGHRVKRYKSQNQYDISDLSSGIYFINIKTSKGETTKKLIKK